MKRNITIAAALMMVLFSSCVRSEDIDLLRHPIHVQGDVDPYFGVPIAYGELTINDIYEMLNANYTGYLDPNENTVTLVFDTIVNDNIHAAGYDPGAKPTPSVATFKGGSKGFVDLIDTVKEYSVDISLFDDARLSSIQPGNLAINHLWLNLNVIYQGHCVPSFEDVVRDSVRAVIDSFTIRYIDHNHIEHLFTGLPEIEPISISNVLERQYITLDSIDLAPIINSMPRKITASFRFKFSIDDGWVMGNVTNPSFVQMMDSIKMTYLEYDADLSVAFPFELHIGMLPYDFTIDLGDGLSTVNIDSLINTLGENVDAELKDSYINLVFDNGIPFDFMMSAVMLDQDSNYLFEVVNLDTIVSAPTAPSPSDPSTYESTGTTQTIVRAMLNQEKLLKLKDARKLHMGMALSTGPNRVSVQRSNNLKVKASLQVHPSVSIDLPILDPILN